MKITTWNVNSVNARIEHLIKFINNDQSDLYLIQELKCTNESFPKDELENIQCGFVLSTAKHAVPVTKINEIEYSQHPLINEIQKTFKNEVNKERS